jgi:small subunit ribosomal protein S1
MSNLNDVKNVKPLDDFDWDEFENGSTSTASKEEQEKAYDNTLSKIQDHEVVEGTVISIDKKKLSSTSATRATASSPHQSSATTPT